ncbi:hypothetical protein BD560DRAFT_382746 [Blakeslea trispora]|nr:hypothetical protein BD560DRAFT_382746 [Blakeslea trispora]
MTDFEQPKLEHMQQDEDHSIKLESELESEIESEVEPEEYVVKIEPEECSVKAELEAESEQDQAELESLHSQQPLSKSTDNEQLICQWNNCLKVFPDHPSLASHLSEDHVGWKKGGYYCDWNNCARQGAKCHNRFALMMHLRIHTGEKPFECKVPDCGLTFGRMDALVRHKKIEHGEGLTTIEKPTKTSPISPYPAKKPMGVKRPALFDSLSKSKKQKHGSIRNSLQTTDWSSGDELDEIQIKVGSRQPMTPGSDYSQYRLARAQLHYILRENEMLQDEYEMAQKKLKRMKTERKVLLEAAMTVEYDEINRKNQDHLEDEEEIDVMTEENDDSMIPADDI